MRQSLRLKARAFLGIFAVATLIALAVRLFLIEDFRISSESMAPGLLKGDLVFVTKFDFSLRLPFSYYDIMTFRRPRPSEVVAFSLPDRGGETFVKRVVAIEGDEVVIRDGRLQVNGVTVNESYVVKPVKDAKDYGPIRIPLGHFFALGDNRPDSIDSRSWGPVPYSCLKGRVKLVWLSVAPGGALRAGRSGTWVN